MCGGLVRQPGPRVRSPFPEVSHNPTPHPLAPAFAVPSLCDCEVCWLLQRFVP